MVERKDLKDEIRQTFLEIRRSISKKELTAGSRHIMNTLVQLQEFKKADFVHCYVSMESAGEVDTLSFINYCISQKKHVLVPKMAANGNLTHHTINSLDELKKNKWGVSEPVGNEPADPAEIQFVAVPMVAGDFYRNRLGYGKGYYDRFLSSIDAFKVGLCFNSTLSWAQLPAESFDVKPDKIITETKVI